MARMKTITVARPHKCRRLFISYVDILAHALGNVGKTRMKNGGVSHFDTPYGVFEDIASLKSSRGVPAILRTSLTVVKMFADISRLFPGRNIATEMKVGRLYDTTNLDGITMRTYDISVRIELGSNLKHHYRGLETYTTKKTVRLLF